MNKAINYFLRSLPWVARALVLFWTGLVCVWWWQSHMMGPTTTMEGTHLPGKIVDGLLVAVPKTPSGVPIFNANDTIQVAFDAARFKGPSDLDVTRYIRRIDNKNFMGDNSHIIDRAPNQHWTKEEADGIARASFYNADLPGGVPEGEYVVWSFGYYYYTPIDLIHIWPFAHTITTAEARFDVRRKGAPP